MRTAAGALLLALALAAPAAAEEHKDAAAAPAAAQEHAAPAAAGPAPAITFGIQTPQQDTSWDEIVATWKEAEALGFHSAWVFDHFIPIIGGSGEDGPVLDGWTLLTALATETERLRIGTLVTGNTYRNPALLAKMATTVDHISNGRLEFGVGAAWSEPEHRAYGFHFGTAKERADRFGEALEVITKLWTEDHPSYEGRFYRLKNAPFAPAPVQRPHPPIVIGGQGKRWIMPLVARYADTWNVPLGLSPDDIRERLDIIEKECARVGRDPCDVKVSAFFTLFTITRIPLAGPVIRFGARFMVGSRVARGVLADSPAAITARLQEYVDVGVTEIILNLQPPFDHDLMRRFATEVMPAFQQPDT